MRSITVLLLGCCMTLQGLCQDSTLVLPTPATESNSGKEEMQPTHIFQSPRLINANTVNLIQKGILEFKVTHNFGDAAGDFGGLKNFFGLDDAQDIRIGFQYGISKHLNVAFARYKGSFQVQRIYELGLKWLMMQQRDNDPSHPLSMALYVNAAVATMKSGTNPNQENFQKGFSERLSNLYQLMIARKFGPLSLQLNPSLVHRNFALPYDQKTLFAMGGAARIHLGGRYSLLFDYFHTFRNQSSKDSFAVRNVNFYDVFGVGFEILTGGHVFTLNFTNTQDILENRFIPRTVKAWEKGQFRWGFSVSREFDMGWKNRSRKK